MSDDMVDKVLQEVMKRVGAAPSAPAEAPAAPSIVPADLMQLTEYVGCTVGDTQGIVIANLDPQVHEVLGLDPKFRSIGIIGGRTGAGPQLMAADEGIKATNTEIVMIEMPRDTKGGAGHGNLIVFGAEDVSDARRAVEVTLQMVPKYFGDVYGNDQGYTENQYTARASKVLNKAFGVPEGRAFGLILGAPRSDRHADDRCCGEVRRRRGSGCRHPEEEHQLQQRGVYLGDRGLRRRAPGGDRRT